MSNIEDEYFLDPQRQSTLLNVLFLWSTRNSKISYRQGMHEIAGVLMLCLETERLGWDNICGTDDVHHPLQPCFTKETLEPQLYCLFERIMSELVVLYDPEVSTMRLSTASVCDNLMWYSHCCLLFSAGEWRWREASSSNRALLYSRAGAFSESDRPGIVSPFRRIGHPGPNLRHAMVSVAVQPRVPGQSLALLACMGCRLCKLPASGV